MEDRGEPASRDWRNIGRPELERLLSAGLTPEQVGALYLRSASSVRVLARRWGLDCRALRARSIGLAARHPDIAEQFIEVVDGAPPHFGPQDLLSGSGARCRWRCPACAEEWVTSVANRVKRNSGCPACAAGRAADRARARVATSPPLDEVSDDLAREFRSNLSRPDRVAATTPSGSHDRVSWRCRRGHEWQTSVRQRVKYGTQCPTCLSGLWTSRLEFQVAELVQLATGLNVRVGASVRRTDRAGSDRVDLLIVEADLLCDLDPSRWHRVDEAVVRDQRKLARFAGARYVRVRPAILGLLAVEGTAPDQQILLESAAEDDASVWAAAVVKALRSFFPSAQIQVASGEARLKALARADRRWRRLRATMRERSLLSEFPAVAQELLHVVDRPHVTPADLAPSSDDRATWRCSTCGHEWEARVANRTVLGTGCPPCSRRRGAALAARPAPGESFGDRHPDLVPYFVRDETNPGRTPTDLKPNSIDRCQWICRYCRRPWTATPHTLHRNPSAGCRPCGYRRGIRNRAARRADPTPDMGDKRIVSHGIVDSRPGGNLPLRCR